MSKNLTKEDWPRFRPYRVTPKGSEFKIGTNDLFVDVPISPLNSALNRIHQIEEDSKTPEDAYQKIKDELEDINSDIQKTIEETVQEKCDWIIVFVRRPPFSNKKYSIQLNIQWDKLLQFLDKVANSQDISLSDKYLYIYGCREFFLPPKTDEVGWISDKDFKKVKDLARRDIEDALERIDSLRKLLASIANELKNKKSFGLFYLYSKDFISSLAQSNFPVIDQMIDKIGLSKAF